MFPEPDDHLLKYLEDDGQIVEPEWYLPILPMVLVNGAEGIGTGWSTNIPCYNPRDLCNIIKNMLKGDKFNEIDPWFKGFSGEIVRNNANSKAGYLINGRFDLNDEEETIHITELPIQKWTKDYKVFLEEMVTGDKAELEDVKEYHTNNRVHFIIKPNDFPRFSNDNLEKKLKLQTSLQITNMVLFDQHGKLKKYPSVQEIFEDFFALRLSFYEKRKEYLISRLKRDLAILENKCRFILGVINQTIKISNVKKKDICLQLQEQGFIQLKDMPKILSTKPQFLDKKQENAGQSDHEEGEEEKENNQEDLAKQYSYLLGMALWSLSFEKIEQLKKEVQKKQLELKDVEETTLETMWIQDLDQFLQVLDEVEEEEEVNRLKRPAVKGGGMKKPRAKAKKKANEEEKEEKGLKNNEKSSEKKEKNAKKKRNEMKNEDSPNKKKPNAKKAVENSIKKENVDNAKKKEENIFTSQYGFNPKPLMERIGAKITQSQSSSSREPVAFEPHQKNIEKKKANCDPEGKVIAKKKIFIDSDEENKDNNNKMIIIDTDEKDNNPAASSNSKRPKMKKNYYESEEEDNDEEYSEYLADLLS